MIASLEEMVDQYKDRWADCHGDSNTTLLRLCILRKLIQTLHAEKSRCLATGQREKAHSMRNWEDQIEALRDCAHLQGDLMGLLQAPPTSKKNRHIPESFFQNFDRDKIFRYDRHWEKTLLAEAISLKWNAWVLEAWVKIPLVQEWDQTLTQKLWPHGIVLFAESASTDFNGDLNGDLWRGNWVTVLHPEIKNPEELSLNLSQWPGSTENPPSPSQWKLIYR